MAGWYIRRGEKIVGPVDSSKLRELVASGRLLPTDELAKEVGGPWTTANKTKLFQHPPAAIATKPEQPPTIIQPPPYQPPAVVEETVQLQPVSRPVVIIKAIGSGVLGALSSVRRYAAVRSQRRHELKVAKFRATAARNQALSEIAQSRRSQQPAYMAPPVSQATVVQVVNKNTNTMYGCSGCFALLLLLILGVAAFFIIAGIIASTPPPQ